MSRHQIVLTSRAITEIQDAINYYNSQSAGLGKRFYLDLKKQINSIKRNPFTRAIRYDDIRFALLDRFPYAAHYCINGTQIIVYGVISTHLNPETSWISRTDH